MSEKIKFYKSYPEFEIQVYGDAFSSFRNDGADAYTYVCIRRGESVIEVEVKDLDVFKAALDKAALAATAAAAKFEKVK